MDVLITSSSRPILIPYLLNSFKRFVDSQCHCKLRYLLHEDFVFPKSSNDVIKWAVNSGVFDVIEKHNPAIGLGLSITHMLNFIKSKYIVYLQDDFEFVRTGIDLDRIFWTMDRHPEINLILFPQYNNKKAVKHFLSRETEFDGCLFTLYDSWSFNPGVWRMNWFKSYWKAFKEYPENNFNKYLRISSYNTGFYFLGGFNEYNFVKHIGCTWRVANWRLINDDYGGDIDFEVCKIKNKKIDRAPWLPPYPKRPVYFKNKRKPNLSKLNKQEKEEFYNMTGICHK